ncbi:hypothetical protein QTO34_019979 [Cnephaeus nilssonii]|uniref:DDE-1 domain-containing protein n=1 Tax=Cnephaeus nilssonii TaxID=3371016 RepID=A0AA40LPJ4_CNENI|nr:hypothetical protein QTO34_019979 [Eptesicus nilssonii]
MGMERPQPQDGVPNPFSPAGATGARYGRARPQMLERTCIHKEAKSMPGFKALKDRIIVLLRGSVAGCKLKPFVIWHSENPRALNTLQTSSFIASFTQGPDTFLNCYASEMEYCLENDIPLKILLIIDSAPGHPPCIGNHPKTKLFFLPSDTISLIQLMDQGIISIVAFKGPQLALIARLRPSGQGRKPLAEAWALGRDPQLAWITCKGSQLAPLEGSTPSQGLKPLAEAWALGRDSQLAPITLRSPGSAPTAKAASLWPRLGLWAGPPAGSIPRSIQGQGLKLLFEAWALVRDPQLAPITAGDPSWFQWPNSTPSQCRKPLAEARALDRDPQLAPIACRGPQLALITCGGPLLALIFPSDLQLQYPSSNNCSPRLQPSWLGVFAYSLSDWPVGVASGRGLTVVGKLRLASHMRLFGPLSVALPQNTMAWPLFPICWQPHSHHCCSHALTALALLTPTDGAERLEPVSAVGVSGAGTVSRCEWWLWCRLWVRVEAATSPIAPQEQGEVEVEKPSGAVGAGSRCSHLLMALSNQDRC